MMILPPRASRRASAFTLVELLVAMGVLVLLVLIVTQMVASTTRVTTASRKHLDADREARLVFDRMAEDFGHMVKRRDVDSLFYKNPTSPGADGANDAMYFFSEAPAYLPTTASGSTNRSSLALVGYRVSPYYQLERFSRTLAWDSSDSTLDPMPVLAFNPAGGVVPVSATTIAGHWPDIVGNPVGSNTSTDPGFHTLSGAVFRMEISFQVCDITHYNTPFVTGSQYPVAYAAKTDASLAPYNTVTIGGSVPVAVVPTNLVKARDRWYDTTNYRTFICATGVNSAGAGAVTWAPQGVDDVVAVVITLAILDTNTAQPFLTPNTLTSNAGTDAYQPPASSLRPSLGASLVKYFPDADQTVLAEPSPTPYGSSYGSPYVPPTFPSITWQAKLPNLATAMSLPPSTAGQVRVYQRIFPLKSP